MLECTVKGKKYILKKEISGETILKENPCRREYDRFVRIYGYMSPVARSNAEFEEFVENCLFNQTGWMVWFLDHGFIEMIDENITYSMGDFFWYRREGTDGLYLLAQVDHGIVNLISVFRSGEPKHFRGGNRFRNGVRVEDPFKITREELRKIGGPLEYLIKVDMRRISFTMENAGATSMLRFGEGRRHRIILPKK